MKTKPSIVLIIWFAVAPNVSTSQPPDKYDLVEVAEDVRNIRASNKGLFAWLNSGVGVIDGDSIASDRFQSLATTANGRAFALRHDAQHVQVFEVGVNETKLIFATTYFKVTNAVLVANENGSRLWSLLHSKSKAKALIINTNSGVVKETDLTNELDDQSNVYVAIGDKLLVASPQLEGTKGTWTLRSLLDSGELSKPLRVFNDTTILRLEPTATGNIAVSGRNRLHEPDSGFLATLDGALQNIWSNSDAIPYSISVCGDYILACDGTNEVSVVSVSSGKNIKVFQFGDCEIVRLASNQSSFWCLCSDKSTIYHTNLTKALQIDNQN